jgi:hypothetical protein
LLEDEEKFHGFPRINTEQFYCMSQLVGEEIRKQNTKYRRAISPEELLAIYLKYALKISVGDKEGILDTIGVALFLINDADCFVVCVPGVTTHSGCIFTAQ